jgi:hypothetical protein
MRSKLINKRQDILDSYKQTGSVWKTGKQLGFNGQSVWRFLKKEGVLIRTPTERTIKHSLDSSIFDTIDSHEKAYWLGMLYADGGLVKNNTSFTIGLTLHRSDRYHLENFKAFLKSSHPINDRKDKEASSVNIGSLKLCKALMDKGISLRKSLVIQYPNWLKDEFVNSFVLGVFDGDGSIWHRKRKRYLTEQCSFSIVGSKELLEGISNAIEKHLGIKSSVRPTGTIFRIVIDGNTQLLKLSKWLYKDQKQFLVRKREIFQTYVENYEKENNRLNKNRCILQIDQEGNIVKKWGSATEVHKTLKVNKSNITKCCNGQLKTSHGYVWKYEK